MNFSQNLKHEQYAASKAETEFYSTNVSLAQYELILFSQKQGQNAS